MKKYTVLYIAGILNLSLLSNCKNVQNTGHKDWPVYLGEKSSSHYSSLNQIDTNNVQQLKVAWIYHTRDASTSGHSEIECNPIEVNGILYATSPRLKLFALDAATGNPQWVFDPFSDTAKAEPRINVNRGVTYWSTTDGNDKRIFYTAGSFLYAVDANTGKLVSSFGNDGKIDLHNGLGRDVPDLYITSTSPGVIYKNLLIIGTRVAERGDAAPGNIRAYDARTGKIKWIFYTIPRPGQLGYNSWQNKNAWKYVGGVNCWAGMSLDQKRGVVYIPTGSPTPDSYGGARKGKDLFSDCILALDAATGKLKWYYQTIHHDLWDRDLPAPPNLITIKHSGKKVDAVAQITKTGFVFVLNRTTGIPLFPIKEAPVPDRSQLIGEKPWPTQPIPQLPKPFMPQKFSESDINTLVPESSQVIIRKRLAQVQTGNMFFPPSEKGMIMFPGFDGGAEWGGAAFDPVSGFLYVNANQVPWTLTMVKIDHRERKKKETITEYGKAVYMSHCVACHGVNRAGSGDYPSLQHIGQKYTEAQILQIINNGRRMMPAFKQLPDKDKKSVVAFLLNLKKGRTSFIASGKKEITNDVMQAPQSPYTMTGYKKFRTPEGYPASKPPWGTLTAINLNTGKTMWQVPLGEYPELTKRGIPITGTENYGGPIVTAGGLLFIAATSDGKFRAFDKTTGKLLWETSLPASGFATPATYKVHGKQFIVVACGGGKLGVPSGDAYVAFALP